MRYSTGQKKERRNHEIQPPGAQLLLTHPLKWVLCLHKSEGTETVALLREDNYSCTVWRENTHANSASSWVCAGVDRKENMLLNTEEPRTACVTAQFHPHAPSSGEPWYPLQSAIQEPQDDTEHGDLHKSKEAQTSFTFIRVHPAHFHLPAPGLHFGHSSEN